MKQKLLFQSVFLAVLLCIFFSQTTLASDMVRAAKEVVQDVGNRAAGDSSGRTDVNQAAADTGSSDTEIAGAGSGQNDMDIDRIVQGLPDAVSADPAAESPAAEPAPTGAQIMMPVPETDSVLNPPGELAGISAYATPEPLANNAAGAGEYTLSLTSSIGTLTYYNQSVGGGATIFMAEATRLQLTDVVLPLSPCWSTVSRNIPASPRILRRGRPITITGPPAMAQSMNSSRTARRLSVSKRILSRIILWKGFWQN